MLYGKYEFGCRFRDEAILPEYKGSTFRGVFGGALRRVTCPLKQQDCADCLLKQKCVYPLIFHTQAVIRPAGTATPPPPLVIVPPADTQTRFSPQAGFTFHLLLFGAVNHNLPYFVYAFEQTGEMGIGKKINGRRARFALETIHSGGNRIYTAQNGTLKTEEAARHLLPPAIEQLQTPRREAVTITLQTPLRVKHHNRLASALPFHVFIRACLRRISEIYNCYGEGEPAWNYPDLIAAAQEVAIGADHLQWKDWERFSGRQQERMKFGGLTGSITYRGVPEYFTPIMALAEKLHLGKQTIFGLGQFTRTPGTNQAENP